MEIYNSDRDRFNNRSLYNDHRIYKKFVEFKWDILVVSGRPPLPIIIRDKIPLKVETSMRLGNFNKTLILT